MKKTAAGAVILLCFLLVSCGAPEGTRPVFLYALSVVPTEDGVRLAALTARGGAPSAETRGESEKYGFETPVFEGESVAEAFDALWRGVGGEDAFAGTVKLYILDEKADNETVREFATVLLSSPRLPLAAGLRVCGDPEGDLCALATACDARDFDAYASRAFASEENAVAALRGLLCV